MQPRVLEVAKMKRDRFEYGVASDSTKEAYLERDTQAVLEEYEDDPIGACRYLTLIRDPDAETIRDFLEENLDLLDDQNGRTPFKRLSCIYDRINYGPGFGAFESE